MINQSNNAVQPVAEMTHFIKMRELTVPVFNLNGVEYVPARELVDYAGINWRSALKTIFTEENTFLYGTCRLDVALYEPNRRTSTTVNQLATQNTRNNDDKTASIDTNRRDITTVMQSNIAKNLQVSEIVCFKLKQAYMYLANISVGRMKSHDKADSAKRLLAIQVEWAEALHDYETHGIAVNKSVFDNTKQLKVLVDIYSKLTDKQQKHVVSKQIDHALGVHRSDNGNKQLDMLDQ